MWALVKDSKVEETYNTPKCIVLDNVRYPSNMFTLYTKEEKKRINIYDINLKDRADVLFYNISTSSYVYDNAQAIPDAVVTYVASVRTHCNTICTAIDNCNNLDNFKIVYEKIYNNSGEYYTWPDYTNVKQYERGS